MTKAAWRCGLVGLIVGPFVAVALGWIWMEHYTRTTGFDAGNAPPFFFLVGLVLGPILGCLFGRLIFRASLT